MRVFGTPSRLDVVSIDGIADPALVVDTFGVVVSCNNEAARLLGCTAAQTLGRHCAAVVRGTLPTGELACTADCPLVQGWGLQLGPPAVEMLIPGTGWRECGQMPDGNNYSGELPGLTQLGTSPRWLRRHGIGSSRVGPALGGPYGTTQAPWPEVSS